MALRVLALMSPFLIAMSGAVLAEELFKTSSSTNRWKGPFVSPYGVHLVVVTRIVPCRTPELEEVAGYVLEDARRAKIDDARRAAVEQMVSRYNVRLEVGIRP